MPDRLTKLRDLTITRVAFVPKGDNPHADIVLWKSAKEDGIGMEKAPSLTPRRVSRLREAWESLGALIDEAGGRKEAQVPEPTDKQYELPGDSPEELKKFVAELEKQRDDAKAATEAVEAELAKVKEGSTEPAPDPVAKALDDADPVLKEVIATLRKDADEAKVAADEAKAAVDKMAEDRATEAAVQRAANFGNLKVTAEFGKTLREIEKASPEAAKAIEDVLASANAQASEMFREIGKGAVDSDAQRELDSIIEKYQAEHVAEAVSKEQATTEVLKTAEGRRAYATVERERREA